MVWQMSPGFDTKPAGGTGAEFLSPCFISFFFPSTRSRLLRCFAQPHTSVLAKFSSHVTKAKVDAAKHPLSRVVFVCKLPIKEVNMMVRSRNTARQKVHCRPVQPALAQGRRTSRLLRFRTPVTSADLSDTLIAFQEWWWTTHSTTKQTVVWMSCVKL